MVLKKCNIENCGNQHKARGYCSKHYKKWKKYGDAEKIVKPRKQATKKFCSVEDCTSDHYAGGFCRLHSRRHKNSGKTTKPNRETTEAVLQILRRKLCSFPDECSDTWEFARNKAGYPVVSSKQFGGSRLLGRIVCKAFYGDPPEDHECAHSCNNPGCYNPKHLRWCTHKGNTDDKKQNDTWGYMSKAKAISIYAAEGTQEEIACRFRVHHSTVGRIKSGRTWNWATKHIIQ